MRLRFGTFMAPFHPPEHNPTLSLEDDLELLELMDRLGYDEAWIGEHHSAGSQIIASPELFIATAAARTRNIKLGTGVISLPYHNPLWVAERMVLLDHLTRGRIMLGVGPGALPTDAAMLGLGPPQMRPLLHEYMEIVMQLLTSDEPVNYSSDRLTLSDARLHLRPYSDPLFDIAVAALASPSGAKLAGKYGAGILSLGATVAVGMDVLAHHWTIQEEVAAAHGRNADRAKWRLVGLMHLAETEQEARRDVEYGMTAVVPVLPERRCIPADGGRRRQHRRDGGLRQRWARRRRDTRAGRRSDRRTARAEQRWLRRLSHARTQLGQPRCHQEELGVVRPPRHAALPERRQRSGRGRRPGPDAPTRARRAATPGGRRGDAELRRGTEDHPVVIPTARPEPGRAVPDLSRSALGRLPS